MLQITEDNDPNNRIGRPNGYLDAAVLYDKRVRCSNGPGADCGATIEIWPNKKDAEARSAYIQSVLKKNPMLGTEYETIRGRALLRVSGDIKPSAARKYASSFLR